MDIIAQLDQLAKLQAEQDTIKLHFEKLRDDVMTPEIQAALIRIYEEEKTSLDAINQRIEQLTKSIKDSVLEEVGVTHTGKFLQAVYSTPRICGAPSVSIRKV